MTQDMETGVGQCEPFREIISARLDGEASAQELVSVEDHLCHCADCVDYESELKRVQNYLENELVADVDLDQLWHRIQISLDREEGDRCESIQPRAGGFGNWLAGVALAACLIISITVGSVLLATQQQPLLPVLAETVRDFETFRMRGETLDIDNENTAEVVQWMSDRLNFELPDTVVPPAGFEIAGGRLCSFLNRRLGFFHYQKDTKDLSLYVMKADGLKLPVSGQYQSETTKNGLTTVTWTRDALAFVIVSELPASEIVEFATRT